MEKLSTEKTGKSRMNWKRLAMFGAPLFLIAVLAVAGIFAVTGAHAAAPTLNNDHASKPGDPKDNNVTVMGTIVKIKDNTLTIRDWSDRNQTMVQIDRNTKFVSKGMGRKNSMRDLKVGDFVTVTGQRNKDRNHSIQAKLIVVSKAPSRSHS